MAEKFAHLPRNAEKLKKFLQGPITLVIRAKKNLSNLLLSKSGNVGVRIPDHQVVLKLVKAAGFPITSTSANISGRPPPLTVEEAVEQIGSSVDLALYCGKCSYGVPSTVLDLTAKPFRILREGPVKREDIERAIGST